MQKRFVAIREDTPGDAWRERFMAGRAEAEAWYRGSGRGALPTAAECTAQLRRAGGETETFLTAPIYSRDASSPTVYSAVYRPAELTVDYLWPGNVMTQGIGSTSADDLDSVEANDRSGSGAREGAAHRQRLLPRWRLPTPFGLGRLSGG